jgi:hypothetical protein
MYGSTACAMLPARLTAVALIRKAQKNRTARAWFRWVISDWLVTAPSFPCQVVPLRLPADLDNDLGVGTEDCEIRRKRADQHVLFALDLADLCLTSDRNLGLLNSQHGRGHIGSISARAGRGEFAGG